MTDRIGNFLSVKLRQLESFFDTTSKKMDSSTEKIKNTFGMKVEIPFDNTSANQQEIENTQRAIFTHFNNEFTLAPEIIAKESKFFDELEGYLNTRVENDLPQIEKSKKRRWVYATGVLSTYDNLTAKKRDINDYKLEIRKMVLDGVRAEDTDRVSSELQKAALDIANENERDLLVQKLVDYVNKDFE